MGLTLEVRRAGAIPLPTVLLRRHHAQRSVIEQSVAFRADHPRGHAAIGGNGSQ